MPGRSGEGERGSRPAEGRGPRPRRTGGLGLRRLGGEDFEFVHPRCIQEMELDYEEGMELWRAGDPEAARDALRFALQGCGDNLWVHVALGRIALEEFRDPSLARGHFGYAYELAMRAIPPGFRGRLVPGRILNQPFYDAAEGLAACYEALEKRPDADEVRATIARLSKGVRERGSARD